MLYKLVIIGIHRIKGPRLLTILVIFTADPPRKSTQSPTRCSLQMFSPISLSFCQLLALYRPLIIGYSSINLLVRPWTNSDTTLRHYARYSRFRTRQSMKAAYTFTRAIIKDRTPKLKLGYSAHMSTPLIIASILSPLSSLLHLADRPPKG